MQQTPNLTPILPDPAQADERLHVTYLERITQKTFDTTRVYRATLMLTAMGLSGFLHLMLFPNVILTILFLDMVTKPNISEEEHKCLQASDSMIDPLPEAASFIIVTALCLLIHKLEKYDIDHARRQDQQPKCSFFRKTIHHHPGASFFFAQLLISVGQRSVTKDCGKLSTNQLMIDGSSLLLVFCIIVPILKQGYGALSPCRTLLGESIERAYLSIEQRQESLRLWSQPYLETVSQASTRALETTYRWSEPYLSRIADYLAEETTGLLDEGQLELERSHLNQV